MGLRRPGQVRKVDGRLEQVSNETVEQLGQGLGVAAPTSPMMGATVGANPDQAKMLGSSMNLRSAVRARTGTETLDRTERTQQFERDVGQEEIAKKKERDRFIQNIPGLAKLDNAMADVVLNSLKPKTTVATQTIGLDFDSISSFVGSNNEALGVLSDVAKDVYKDGVLTQPSLLTRALRGEQLSSAEQQKLEQAFESDTLKDYNLTIDVLKENFLKDPNDQLAEQILLSKKSEIRLGDLDETTLRKFGVDPDYLKSVYGDNAELAKGKTFEQFKMDVMELQSAFSDVRELERITTDPMASATQRREANKRLRELGHLGRRADMEKVNDLEKQIEDGDTVKIGNAVFEIEDILEDEDFMESFRDALADEKEMKVLEENNPELAAWLKSNKSALDAQFTQMSGRLAPGTKVTDMFRQDIDTVSKDYDIDPTFFRMAADTLFPDGATTLSATQTEQVLGQVQAQSNQRRTAFTGTVTGSFVGFPKAEVDAISTDLLKDVDVDSLSPSDWNSLVSTRIAGKQRELFDKSPYNAQLNELKSLYTSLGKKLPPEIKELTPSEWATMAKKPDLAAFVSAARKERQTADWKTAAQNTFKAYDSYPPSLREFLAGGNAARLQQMLDGKIEPVINSANKKLVDDWLANGKTPLEKGMYASALSKVVGKTVPGTNLQYTSVLNSDALPFLKKTPGALAALSKDPEKVINTVRIARANDVKFTNALKAKDGNYKAIFEGVFDPTFAGTLTDLYKEHAGKKLTKQVVTGSKPERRARRNGFGFETVNVPTYSNVSAWDKKLDANQDGILDDPKVILQAAKNSQTAALNSFVSPNGTISGQEMDQTKITKTLFESAIPEAAKIVQAGKENALWTKDGFASAYGAVARDPELKEAMAAAGIPTNLNAATWSSRGEDSRALIMKEVRRIQSNLDRWKTTASKFTFGSNTPQDKLYQEVFGGKPPSKKDFVNAANPSELTAKMEKQYKEVNALSQLPSKLSEVGFGNPSIQSSFMGFAKKAAQGQLPGVNGAAEFLRKLSNPPPKERKEERTVRIVPIPNAPRGAAQFRTIPVIIIKERNNNVFNPEKAQWEKSSQGKWVEVSRRDGK